MKQPPSSMSESYACPVVVLDRENVAALFNNNAPNSAQICLLGIERTKGWIESLIGDVIPKYTYDKLLSLKGKKPRGAQVKEWRNGVTIIDKGLQPIPEYEDDDDDEEELVSQMAHPNLPPVVTCRPVDDYMKFERVKIDAIKKRMAEWNTSFLLKVYADNTAPYWKEAAQESLIERGEIKPPIIPKMKKKPTKKQKAFFSHNREIIQANKQMDKEFKNIQF